jgi:hypothetical protein
VTSSQNVGSKCSPKLNDAQLQRIARHGEQRHVPAGEILYDQGTSALGIHVVLSGAVEIARPSSSSVRRSSGGSFKKTRKVRRGSAGTEAHSAVAPTPPDTRRRQRHPTHGQAKKRLANLYDKAG